MIKYAKNKFNQLQSNRFVKNVTVLAGGVAFAQVLTILILPLLTRLYTPQDFEILALYTSILSIVGVVACLRFEIAIPIPKDNKTAINLVVISLISTLSFVLLALLVIMIIPDQISYLTGSKLDGYLWLFPVGLLFTGFYSALQYWAVRKKEFGVVTKTRITQSIAGASTQTAFGFNGIAPLGLLIGQVLQSGAGVLVLGKQFIKDVGRGFNSITTFDLKTTFKDYDRYPKYSTWEAVANSAGVHIPIIIISTYALGSEAGFILLAMKLMSAPMSLIGGAVSQVYLSEAVSEYQEGRLRKFTLNTMFSLLKVGFIPIIIVAFTAPFLVPIIFGVEWGRAGILMAWMSPWFLLQFIVSPVSMALHIVNSQSTAMMLQVFGLFLRGGMVSYVAYSGGSYIGEIFSISGLIFYAVYSLVVLKILRGVSCK